MVLLGAGEASTTLGKVLYIFLKCVYFISDGSY